MIGSGADVSERVLSRFAESLPLRPYCTENLSFGLKIRAKGVALKMPYIQHNRPNKISYLTFDVDQEFGAFIAEDVGLPIPSITVTNPENGHAHVMYELSCPVYYGSKNQKPMRYLTIIQRYFTRILRADKSYVGLIVKNPLHGFWRVLISGIIYELSYLAEWVDFEYIFLDENEQYSQLGRNCALFERVRVWAYVEVHRHLSFPAFQESVLEKAVHENDVLFDISLNFVEVQCVARSIAKWTWNHRENLAKRSQQNAGVINPDNSVSLAERQRMGAEYTAKLKREKNEEVIIEAIGTLIASGKQVTKSAVSQMTGIYRGVLSRYYSHLFHGE
jgi:hypothetical protein